MNCKRLLVLFCIGVVTKVQELCADNASNISEFSGSGDLQSFNTLHPMPQTVSLSTHITSKIQTEMSTFIYITATSTAITALPTATSPQSKPSLALIFGGTLLILFILALATIIATLVFLKKKKRKHHIITNEINITGDVVLKSIQVKPESSNNDLLNQKPATPNLQNHVGEISVAMSFVNEANTTQEVNDIIGYVGEDPEYHQNSNAIFESTENLKTDNSTCIKTRKENHQSDHQKSIIEKAKNEEPVSNLYSSPVHKEIKSSSPQTSNALFTALYTTHDHEVDIEADNEVEDQQSHYYSVVRDNSTSESKQFTIKHTGYEDEPNPYLVPMTSSQRDRLDSPCHSHHSNEQEASPYLTPVSRTSFHSSCSESIYEMEPGLSQLSTDYLISSCRRKSSTILSESHYELEPESASEYLVPNSRRPSATILSESPYELEPEPASEYLVPTRRQSATILLESPYEMEPESVSDYLVPTSRRRSATILSESPYEMEPGQSKTIAPYITTVSRGRSQTTPLGVHYGMDPTQPQSPSPYLTPLECRQVMNPLKESLSTDFLETPIYMNQTSTSFSKYRSSSDTDRTIKQADPYAVVNLSGRSLPTTSHENIEEDEYAVVQTREPLFTERQSAKRLSIDVDYAVPIINGHRDMKRQRPHSMANLISDDSEYTIPHEASFAPKRAIPVVSLNSYSEPQYSIPEGIGP